MTTTDAEQMKLSLVTDPFGARDEPPAAGAAGAVEQPAAHDAGSGGGIVATADASTSAPRASRRSWAERAADASLGQVRRERRAGVGGGPADPTVSLDGHIAHALGRIGPDALRDFATALSKRITTDGSATIARLVVLLRERLAHALRDTLLALATPLVPVRDRLLFVPVSGRLDAGRARDLTDLLLHGIHAHRARVAVIDLAGTSGVPGEPDALSPGATRAPAAMPNPAANTSANTSAIASERHASQDAANDAANHAANVASQLLHAVRAARLLGAVVIMTGMSRTLAHAVSQGGADADTMRIAPTLSEGVREAERVLDHIVPMTTIARSARWSTENT